MCNYLRISLLLLSLTTLLIGNVDSELFAVKANATLPTVRDSTAAIYDGSDSIYIFGGWTGSASSEILKYSISADTIEVVANFPEHRRTGTVSLDQAGNIFYHGGFAQGPRAEIFKFSPSTNSVENVTTLLPIPNSYGAAVTDDQNPDNVYIFGGWEDSRGIVIFNMEDLSAQRVPVDMSGSYQYVTAVSIGQGAALVFGNTAAINFGTTSVRKIDLSSLQTTFGAKIFPWFTEVPASIWDGNAYAYIIGGYGKLSGVGLRSDSILRFNPATMLHTVIPVTDFPSYADDDIFGGTSAVFVPKLNRIYFFGGQSSISPWTIYDDIWYIDLTPLNE